MRRVRALKLSTATTAVADSALLFSEGKVTVIEQVPVTPAAAEDCTATCGRLLLPGCVTVHRVDPCSQGEWGVCGHVGLAGRCA